MIGDRSEFRRTREAQFRRLATPFPEPNVLPHAPTYRALHDGCVAKVHLGWAGMALIDPD